MHRAEGPTPGNVHGVKGLSREPGYAEVLLSVPVSLPTSTSGIFSSSLSCRMIIGLMTRKAITSSARTGIATFSTFFIFSLLSFYRLPY